MLDLPSNQCCGCSSCANTCPVDAIKMEEDALGFLYPNVDPSLCILCKACINTCPSINPPTKNRVLETNAAQVNNSDLLKSVASGGIASLLSRSIIDLGGVVYGCCQESVNAFYHIRCSSEKETIKLQGSKYVQSEIGLIFRNVKNDLKNKLNVLFIGTPCQIAGLKNFLRKDYETLYTIDLICHGVPSQSILSNYLSHELRREKLSLNDIFAIFRWKEKSGISFGTKLVNKKGENIKVINRVNNPYMSAFFNGYTYRDYCHSCQFADDKRIGDITLGDFWGLGEKIPTKLNVKNGVSLVLVNSEKGFKLFDKIKSRVASEQHDLIEAKKFNKNLNAPSERPIDKDDFWQDYSAHGLIYAVKKHIPSYNRERKIVFRIYLWLATVLINIKKKIH